MTNNKKPGSNLDPNKVDSVEGGIVAFLWRQILSDLKLQQHLSFLIREASKSTSRDENEASKAKTRTQLTNQATATTMTFKIFVRLLRMIVGVTKIKVSVEIERANGKMSTHSTGFFNIGMLDIGPNDESLPENLLNKIRESEALDKEPESSNTEGDKQ